MMGRRIWGSRLLHAVPFGIALIVFGAVFAASGDGDLLFAMMSGISGGLLTYLLALLHINAGTDNR